MIDGDNVLLNKDAKVTVVFCFVLSLERVYIDNDVVLQILYEKNICTEVWLRQKNRNIIKKI
jgi:hypothetical protein